MFHRDVFLVCPMKSAPVLLRKKAEEEDYDHISLPTQGEVNDAAAAAVVVVAVVVVVVAAAAFLLSLPPTHLLQSELNIVASFDRRGDRIVTGSSKGKMLIVDTESLQVLKTLKFSGNAIKSIEFPRRGR